MDAELYLIYGFKCRERRNHLIGRKTVQIIWKPATKLIVSWFRGAAIEALSG
jgi:hypothetical protein